MSVTYLVHLFKRRVGRSKQCPLSRLFQLIHQIGFGQDIFEKGELDVGFDHFPQGFGCWHDHFVNDMDDTVGGIMIPGSNLGAVGHDSPLGIGIVDSHSDVVIVDTLQDILIPDIGSINKSWNNMRLEDLIQGWSFHDCNVSLLPVAEAIIHIVGDTVQGIYLLKFMPVNGIIGLSFMNYLWIICDQVPEIFNGIIRWNKDSDIVVQFRFDAR